MNNIRRRDMNVVRLPPEDEFITLMPYVDFRGNMELAEAWEREQPWWHFVNQDQSYIELQESEDGT